MSKQIDTILPIASKWWFSLLLLSPVITVLKQFYQALSRNILMAVNYSYPEILKPFLVPLDFLTLFIHEAGHTFFSIFGWRFLTIAGGTLLQLMIPVALLFSSLWNKQMRTAQFSFFWLGFSWLETAAYCADARWTSLPLIGNLPDSAHDFKNILSMTGLLDHYMIIAWIFFLFGVFFLASALLWPARDQEARYIDLSDELNRNGI